MKKNDLICHQKAYKMHKIINDYARHSYAAIKKVPCNATNKI